MGKRRTVLFVDDEVRLLRALERGLAREPYDKLFAESGEEALALLEKHEVQVIVTDMRMPEMSGLELLRIVKQRYPHIVRIVLSGYTQVTTLLTAINQGEIYRFITKPWNMENDFKPSIQQALEHHDLQVGTDAPASAATHQDESIDHG
jgi:DNA-binding NtrC family response regulator